MTVLVFIGIATVKTVFFFPGLIDDAAAAKYERDTLKSLSLPIGADIIEAVHGCGNTSGTGDHTEMVAAILVRSENGQDTLADLAPLIDDGCLQTSLMACIDKSFEYSCSFENCFVLQYIDDAPLNLLDSRGR